MEDNELMPVAFARKKNAITLCTLASIIVAIVLVAINLIFLIFQASAINSVQTNLANTTAAARATENNTLYLQQEMGHVASMTHRLAHAVTHPIYKYGVTHMLPRTFQNNRGTCWAFAAIQVLGGSYRMAAIRNGWLPPDQYVPFSEQAFAIKMIDECKKAKTPGKPGPCDEFGDGVADGHTAGGEIGWLKYLPEMWNKVLPVTICPYTEEAQELECPGLVEALAKNPIKFTIKSMNTTYDVEMSRRLLLNTGRIIGWSSPTAYVSYYIPCQDAMAAQPACSEANRVTCPTNRHYGTEFCARLETSGYNMEAEFYAHDQYTIHGGHAMTAVGFNDKWVTANGHVGAFILMNSWHDEVYPIPRGPRGSHSLPFFLGERGDWDERIVCPNSRNPRNWLSCIDMQVGLYV